jgi:MFS family permease
MGIDRHDGAVPLPLPSRRAGLPPEPAMRTFGLLAGWAAFGIFWGGWGALLPAVKSGTGASDGQLGSALLFIAAAALPVMPLMGRVYDRYGRRLVPAALAGFAVAVGLTAAADSPARLMLLLAVLGAGSGAVDVALSSAVASVEAARDAPLMYAAHATFAAAGLVGAVSVGTARELGAGRVPVLLVLAVLAALTAVANAGVRSAARPAARRAGA